MALRKLELGLIECGELEAAVNEKLALLAKDLFDRPGIETARTVNVSISIKPKVHDLGHGRKKTHVLIEWSCKHTMPGASGMQTRGFLTDDGSVVINDADPMAENPDQGTIFDEIPGGLGEPKRKQIIQG